MDGCDRRFRSLRAFEEHYHASHRFRCIQCGRTFVNRRLLDIHITETHDSFFFAVRKTRPMYQCFVESCTEAFFDASDRKQHLLEDHSFPCGFDFSFVHGGKERQKHGKTRASSSSNVRRRGGKIGRGSGFCGKGRNTRGRTKGEMRVEEKASKTTPQWHANEMDEEKGDDLVHRFQYLHVKESVPKEIRFGRKGKR
eukprot:TRINITY_DN7915_c2_g1_i3.p1 TRINITY_DN7915_c2_g1~~TRINITY_DN7915_c2_g1_i3.p1  ORF type:complete len:231 (-),score=59.11 TRINITY_DN7915_c2_g1_i3:22-612(-)